MKVSTERVLVTGASRGIGRAVAERLADAGGQVFATGRDAAALKDLRKRAPDRIATFEAELTDVGARNKLFDFATRLWDGLDGLVCCAGVVEYQEVGAVDEASLRAQLDVNLIAPAMLLEAFTKHLRRREAPGAVVLVGSTLAMRPAPRTTAYASTKAALHALARGYALELGPFDIRVNAVAPGVIDTDMIRGSRTPAEVEELAKLHLLGRLGTPEEVAEAVHYLLDAEYVTGEVYVVDGGLTVG